MSSNNNNNNVTGESNKLASSTRSSPLLASSNSSNRGGIPYTQHEEKKIKELDLSSTPSSSTSTSNKQQQLHHQQHQQQQGNKEGLNSDSFQTCLRLLSSSVDEERFVGLILVKNIIKSDDYVNMIKVFNHLGVEFLVRLLQSTDLKGDESISYHILSITILSTFVALEYPQEFDTKQTIIYRLTQSESIHQLIKFMLINLNQDEYNYNQITETIKFLFTILSYESTLLDLINLESNENKKQQSPHKTILSSDILQQEDNMRLLSKLLVTLAAREEKAKQQNILKKKEQGKQIEEEDIVESNNQQQKEETEEKQTEEEEVLQTLVVLLQILFFRIQEKNEKNQFEKCKPILLELTGLFKTRNDIVKFQITPILILIFQFDGLPKHRLTHSPQYKQSLDNIANGLYSIFSSGAILKEDHRDQPIILLSLLFDLYGGNWIMVNQASDGKEKRAVGDRLFMLASQLVRQEIQMILLQQPLDQQITDDKLSLLLSCYSILENIINHLVDQYESMESSSSSSLSNNNSIVKSNLEMIDIDQLLNLRNILIDCNSIMIEYLKGVAEDMPDIEPSHLFIITLKRVGHFMAEEGASLSTVLNESLGVILNYLLIHRKEYGHFISFILPGILNYLELDDYIEDQYNNQNNNNNNSNNQNQTEKKEENGLSFFYQQKGHTALCKYFVNYLSSFLSFIYHQQTNTSIQSNDPANTQQNNSLYNSFITFDITPESIVNVIIPSLCTILKAYLNPMYYGNYNQFQTDFQQNKSTFVTLYIGLTESIQHLVSLYEASPPIGDHYRDKQYIMANLVSLSLLILSHLDPSDFQSTYHTQSLLKSVDNITNFYSSMEFPPSDQSYFLIWNEFKYQWLNGIDLMTLCMDRFSVIVNSFSTKGWPPLDFHIKSLEQLNVPRQVGETLISQDFIQKINTSMGNLLRKLINCSKVGNN